MAFSVVMAPAPPPPATGTSFHAYPSLVRSCLRTFSAAASPPEVHQCSICTSLMSAAFAVAAKPRTDAAIALVNSRLRGFIVLPSRAYPLPPDSVRLRFQKPCVGFRSFFRSRQVRGAASSCADLRERGTSSPYNRQAQDRRPDLPYPSNDRSARFQVLPKVGARLARNAATPSTRSCVIAVSPPASPSIGASESSPSAKLIIALTIWTAIGPRLATSAAM